MRQTKKTDLQSVFDKLAVAEMRISGKSVAEIAEAFGYPKSTVRDLCTRAKGMLKGPRYKNKFLVRYGWDWIVSDSRT